MSLWDILASAKGELGTAGFIGSMVAAVMEWRGVVASLRIIFVGTASAVYLSPLAIPLIEWALGGISVPEENAPSIGGFLMGIVGVVVIEIIIDGFRIKRAELRRKRRDGSDVDDPDN